MVPVKIVEKSSRITGVIKRYVAAWLDMLTLVCMSLFGKKAVCYIIRRETMLSPAYRQRKSGRY